MFCEPCEGKADLPRPGGRLRFHVRHLTATVTVAFSEPPGGKNDDDTKDETCGGKAVQDRERAFFRLWHVIRHLPTVTKQTKLAASEFQQLNQQNGPPNACTRAARGTNRRSYRGVRGYADSWKQPGRVQPVPDVEKQMPRNGAAPGQA